MEKIFIVGNPNTGKSTLFNSLTKSNEHTGNYHGVTVDAKSKIVKFNNVEYQIVDLPGLYSTNCFSMEEEVAKNNILNNNSKRILYLINAFNFKRNLLLCLQLLKQGLNLTICINNYENFEAGGGKIDEKKLSNILGVVCIKINAKTQKLSNKILKDSEKSEIDNSFLNKLNSCETVEDFYALIEEISSQVYCPKTTKQSKLDKIFLNIKIFLPLFIIAMFLALYLIFFLIGPHLAKALSSFVNIFIASPILSLISKIFGGSWIGLFVKEGVVNSSLTLCSFLPQVCLLYLFLTLLEESGIIARICFMLDDYLNKVGLNGKCVYTMLMGFGCNTSACFTCKNMSDRNSKIKTCLITPFMSCSAKLPVYTVVATAILGVNNFWLIFLLYLLGIMVAITISFILEKTILKSKNDNFIMEFPTLKLPELKSITKTTFVACKQFIAKIFAVVVMMSAILWLLNNLDFKFMFVKDYQQSMLYNISKSLSWMFKPIGLNSPSIVASLVIGIIAKELIVSSMLIFNNTSSIQSLTSSLALTSSPICFNLSTGLSFLVFVLLYAPCFSTIAVMLKEIGKKWTIFALFLQFVVAYLLSMLIYAICIKSFVFIGLFVIGVVGLVFMFRLLLSKVVNPKQCNKLCKNNCCSKNI